ncbi:Sodium/calcium exchanger protein-domain-containing protein [Syncephalis fuscata]|nr:Sodium/calcium exchanger protein-domain-containing protein [Syncephalis fuscata]
MSRETNRQATRVARLASMSRGPDSPGFLALPSPSLILADTDDQSMLDPYFHPTPTLAFSFYNFFLGSYANILLLASPLGFIAYYAGWSGTWIFTLNFLAIIPLASMLGYATEEIALRFGETIGGLLNATFGNAVELIIAIVAVKDGLIRVVQASLLGSILSNLLLVLGFCFLLGGCKYSEQTFSLTAASNYASLLALSCLSLLIPAAFWMTLADHDKASEAVLQLSHISAIFLLIIYLLFLYFQLHTHAHLYETVQEEVVVDTRHPLHNDNLSDDGQSAQLKEQDEDDDNEYPTLTLSFAMAALVGVTILVSFHADMLVAAIESITKGGVLTDTFVGLILLPIVGNAAEHMTAVTTAMKNKMDLAIGVALGSSMQIALLVTPLLVIIGWIIGQPMTLFFHGFETVVMLFLCLSPTILLWMARVTGWKALCCWEPMQLSLSLSSTTLRLNYCFYANVCVNCY